jgi:hypothetical protein
MPWFQSVNKLIILDLLTPFIYFFEISSGTWIKQLQLKNIRNSNLCYFIYRCMQHSAVLLIYYIYIIWFLNICVCKYKYLRYWSFYISISFTGGQLSRISNAKIFLTITNKIV